MEYHFNRMKFDINLESFSERVALMLEDGSSVSYKKLAEQCDALQEQMGTSKKLLCVLCKTNVETIVGYLAGLRGSHAVMMINAELNEELLDQLIERYQPDYMWQPIEENNRGIYEDGDYQLIKRNVVETFILNKDLVLLLSTSGSTGSPKFVKLTKKNLYANTASIAEYLKIRDDEKAITSLPLYYSFGLSILNTHLAAGATLLLTDKSITTKEFWDFFKHENATSFSGVPYTYEMLKKIRFFKMQLPSLRTLTQAGGKLNPKLVEKFAQYAKEKKVDFFVMYGQTEATARISYLPPIYNQTHYKSIGITIPGGRISLIDDKGKEIIESEKEGELVYLGDNVMMGYATCREDFSKPDEQYGSLKTGDIAYRDKEGFYYITGRTKRFIKIFGNRVNLDEIEHSLKSEGFDCLCAGEDDLLKVAILELSISESVKKQIIDKYGFHHSAVQVVVVSEFPVTSSGKIEYQKLFTKIKSEKYE